MRKRRFSERLIAFLLAILMAFSVSWTYDMSPAYASEIGGEQGGDGEDNPEDVTTPSEVSYSVTVTAPQDVRYYAGDTINTPFTATVIRNGVPVNEASVSWDIFKDEKYATINAGGYITISPSTPANTNIMVRATYYIPEEDGGGTTFNTVQITTSVKPVYSININELQGPFYPGQTYDLTAAVTKDSVPLENAQVTWSVTAGASIDSFNKLTINPDTWDGTSITITATYTIPSEDGGGTVTDDYTIITSMEKVTVTGKVTDSVAENGVYSGLAGAQVIFTPDGHSDFAVTVQTQPDGTYTAEIYKNVQYTITVGSYEGYASPEAKVQTFNDTAENVDFQLVSTAELTISFAPDPLPYGNTLTLTATNGAGGPEWNPNWPIQWTINGDVQQDTGSQLVIEKAKYDDKITVTASSHGKTSKTVEIPVSAAEIAPSIDVINADGDSVNSGEENPVYVYTGDTIKVQNSYSDVHGDKIKEGTVNFTLLRWNADDNAWEEIATQSCSFDPTTDSAILEWDLTDTIKYSGQYKIKAEYVSNQHYISNAVEKEFSVSLKTGQAINFTNDTGAITEYTVEYDSNLNKKYIDFTAIVSPDIDNSSDEDIVAQLKTVDYWSVSASVTDVVSNIKVANLNVEKDEASGLYKVSGQIEFSTEKVGKLNLTLTYTDSLNDQNVYQDATVTIALEVAPKPVQISNITFEADRIYNAQTDVIVDSFSLNADQIVNNDQVLIASGKYTLAGKDVTADGQPLNIDSQAGGTSLVLSGEDAANYTLDTSNINDFKCEIIPATITVDLGELTSAYYSGKYTSNASLQEYVKENKYTVFGGFYNDGSDINGMIDRLISSEYIPVFSTNASPDSPMFDENGEITYTIYAQDPSQENLKPSNPSGLDNYDFYLSDTAEGKTQVGTLKFISRDVSADDYELSGTNALWQKDTKDRFWIRQGSTFSVDPANPSIQVSDEIGFNAVYYYSDAEGQNKINGNIDINDSNEYTLYFRLVKVNDENQVVARTNVKTITAVPDGTVEGTIDVTANNTNESFVNSLITTLTLGLFGNKDNAKASVTGTDEGTNGSGIASVQYIVEDYDLYADMSEEEMLADLSERTNWAGSSDSSVKDITFDDGRQIVFARIIDKVGNVRYLGTNGIVVDSVVTNADNIDLQIVNQKDNGVYNTDVTVSFDISDFIDDETIFSGIKDVQYQAYLNDKAQTADGWSGKLSVEYVTDAHNADELKSEAARYNDEFTIPWEDVVSTSANAKNHVTVEVWATDYAGNTTDKASIAFDFDVASPEVSVSFDGDVVNELYFNADRTVTISVTDAYFLENGYGLAQFTGIEGASPALGYENGWKSLGDYRYEMKFCYQTDGIKQFDVSITDAAGNKTGMDTNVPAHYRNFVIDKTLPEIISVKYYMYVNKNVMEITSQMAKEQRYYGNDKIYAVITLKEHNFIETDVSAGKVGGLDIHIDAENREQEYTNPVYAWAEHQGDIHTLRVDYNSDANYTFDMNYTDLAGNELSADYIADLFTVDTANPSATISLENIGGIWSDFLSTITFGLFSNQSQVVTISNESDVTAGVQSVEYYKSHNECTVSQLDNVSWTAGKSLTITANERCVVYGKITDRSGNYTYISTNGFVVDDRIDNPIISIVTPEPLNHIYNGAVDVQITVEDPDPTGNDDFSGLSSVYYEIRSNGTVTKSGNIAVEAGSARQKSVTETVRIDAIPANDTNNVEVYVEAYDNAGNRSELTSEPIAIDITQPEISVSFDNNSPLNGQYYQNTRTATITVRERNFDPNNVQINITNTDGTRPTVTGWSSSSNAGLSNDATHTCQIIFAADGDYTFTVNCTDLALNSAANPYQSEEFTIDKTLPTVSVSYNNNDVLNGHYYSAARTATVTITEHNFRASEVRVTTTASLNDSSISAPSISGWSTSGDRHTATISFSGDGDYTFDIAYTDLAGNAMADYAQDSFTVDLTDPEIEITGVENRSANKGTVAPVITLSDTNYTADGVTLTLTGANKGRINVDSMVSRTSNGNGQIITFRNFGSNMDDIYTLTARLVDRAGNETTRSITFSVNRDGSTYELDDYVAQLIETGFTNSPKDIVIKEINVDTLEFIEITYSKDGEVVTLKEGVDYTVEEEGGDGQWKVYTYTIKASCFEEEGQYSINIYSEDRAQNTSTYQVKNSKLEKEEQMTLEFIVDKTAPSISIANLEDRGRYRESAHEFTLSVKDNMLLSYVELYLDGVLYHTYSGDELTIDDGVLTITVDSKDAYQTVKIIAYDAAGNPTDPVEYQVLVTSNWWIQFYMNKPLFFGCIAGIVVVAGVIIFLVVRSRRKADKKTYKKI